jgi:ribosomal protein L11 methyltransferase
MYLWRRRASPRWWFDREANLRARFGRYLAIIERPNRTQLEIEIVCSSKTRLNHLGGQIEKLPRNWLERVAREQKAKSLKIGERLVISNVGGALVPRPRSARAESRQKGRSQIFIPPGVAFGTGEHATTAMSLRLLERISRKWTQSWSLIDLGTGSGILALAAKSLGAGRAIGIDIDPIAISTARANARLNKIHQVEFQVADVRSWRPPGKTDVLTANIFSDLLIRLLPKLKRSNWVILSGILRREERDVLAAVKRHGFKIVDVRRRGKWIAMVASSS